MPTSISRTDPRSSLPYVTDQQESSAKKNISQTELISQLEKEPFQKELSYKQLKAKTDEAKDKFINRSTTFVVANSLYNFCNVGEKDPDKDKKLLYVVKDLTKCKNPGFFKIRSVMRRYFKHLSFFRMFFLYYSFISWVPNLYIRTTVNQILNTSRKELKEGKNLPDLGSKVVKTANTYLANYNHAVNKFRDDDLDPTADRDESLKQALKHPKILGYDSLSKLYSEFAKAASKEEMRPGIRPLSKTVKKIQLLDFKILNRIPKAFLLPIKAITLMLGTIPYILARLLEIPPNAIITIFHRRTIASFVPSVLEDTVKAVNRAGFTHAINCFLCDIINDALIEMEKDPYLKSTHEPPKIVDKSLSADIKKFSELLFTLITRAPYETKEELKRIQKDGIDPKTWIERLLKLPSAHYIDRVWIKYFFVDKALHPNIIDLFNFLFGQPEKFEEYLCNLIDLLNKIYDHVPDSATPEGRALLEEQYEKQERREALVNKLIKDGITYATDDGINEYLRVLSKNQNKDLILTYRKIKEKTLKKLPTLQIDARNLLVSCKDLIDSFSPISSKTQAKEDIELAKNDLKNFFTIIQNIMPKENGRIKKEMDSHLRNFKVNEKILLDSLNQVDILHDEIEQLKSLTKELKKFKINLSSNTKNLGKIKESLTSILALKSGLKFDSLINEYQFLSDQFEKIKTHQNYIATIKDLLRNTLFKDGLLMQLAKAQKDYLSSPKSISKEKRLKALFEKMLLTLNNLKTIAEDSDINEMKDVIRKISIAPNSKKLNLAYKNARLLFENKLSKHLSLLEDEKQILISKGLDKSKSILKKQENEFSKQFKDTHENLMQNAKIFNDTIEKLKDVTKDIDKKKHLGLNGTTIAQTIGSSITAASGYLLSSSHPVLSTISLAGSAILAASTKLRPLRSAASYTAVPLAKASADSAYKVITNSAFYEGLIHAYMKDFINYAKKSK